MARPAPPYSCFFGSVSGASPASGSTGIVTGPPQSSSSSSSSSTSSSEYYNSKKPNSDGDLTEFSTTGPLG